VRIERLHPVHNGEERRHKGFFVGVHDPLIVPAHHLGIEVGAIDELDPFPQVKHIDLAVFQDLPGFGQVGDIVQLAIDGEQAVEEIARDVPRLDARGDIRIQPGDIGLPPPPRPI
jgi:hypothetical protein